MFAAGDIAATAVEAEEHNAAGNAATGEVEEADIAAVGEVGVGADSDTVEQEEEEVRKACSGMSFQTWPSCHTDQPAAAAAEVVADLSNSAVEVGVAGNSTSAEQAEAVGAESHMTLAQASRKAGVVAHMMTYSRAVVSGDMAHCTEIEGEEGVTVTAKVCRACS